MTRWTPARTGHRMRRAAMGPGPPERETTTKPSAAAPLHTASTPGRSAKACALTTGLVRSHATAFAPRHHLDLPGARAVPLPVHEVLAQALQQTVDQRAVMCLYGDAGCGKTFALNTTLASTLPAGRTRVIRLLPRPAPTPSALRTDLAHALGIDARPEDPRAFDTAVRRTMSARDHLLVIDEAQRLDGTCFEYLRYLFDDPATRLAIVLAVGEKGLALLRRQSMLASRTAVWLNLPALSCDEVHWVIPRFHPLWRSSDPDALTLLDTRLCHGNFRRWAQATHHTLRLARASPSVGRPLLEDLLRARLLPHPDT
ncbi:AAA family ATPase [Streptomyces sp. NPDC088748]|uniref:AAA family ATPase n=1 Tax=Streptomyces sp. NPDC088748 TaxID=3365887 RepID=UPI0038162334